MEHNQGEDINTVNAMLLYSDSPLIEIIDDFASAQDAISEDQEERRCKVMWTYQH